MKLLTLFLLFFLATPALAQETPPVHALAMHGAPKYGPDFTHFDYVNPDAPKGGTLRLHSLEGFDSLNPFIIKGVTVDGIGMIYETLMEKSADEPFTMYGYIAQTVEMPEDRSWIVFNLNPKARWQDGKPITAEDVVWSFETLKEKGAPFYRSYYADVAKTEILGERKVKFTFGAKNPELPLILGELTVLPKHYWTEKGRDFGATSLEPPPGSGPYKIGKLDPGHSIEYVKDKDWWAADLPVMRGRYNFDRITYDYYKDRTVALEAFLAGEYDFRQEFTAKLWATGYTGPGMDSGRIVKKDIPNGLPQGMQGFVYNIRRPIFQDREVRRALDHAFDFEWSNKQFAYGAYTRTRSYFDNSNMAAISLPEGAELAFLEPWRGKIPDEVFTQDYNPAKTDGSGNNRAGLKKAMEILDAAGWKLGPDGVREKNGVKLEFEFLTSGANADFDRWLTPFFANLKRLGVKADFRVVDASQYVNRMLDHNFDMIVHSFGQSLSPGNEQREYWKSDRVDVQGSRNMIGLKDPAVDDLVEKIIAAKDQAELEAACRALDRVLQWGYYVIPNWHISAWRAAWRDTFAQPDVQAPYALGAVDTWWMKHESR